VAVAEEFLHLQNVAAAKGASNCVAPSLAQADRIPLAAINHPRRLLVPLRPLCEPGTRPFATVKLYPVVERLLGELRFVGQRDDLLGQVGRAAVLGQ